jgi:2-C-methyl-D-erythritol 4-phosphate cytidylyltransferase
MNIALIFAGGTGQRMSTVAKPKQFLELHGKPIILYTLEHFESHSEIDSIIVVCLEDWIKELEFALRKYEIKKVSQIIPGAGTAHESILKGLLALEKDCAHDDIVLIHDGVRPLINERLIAENIEKAKEHGAVITVEAVRESVVISEDGDLVDYVPRRRSVFTAKAPQTFHFGLILGLYKRALADNILSVDSAHLLNIYGEKMYTVKSTPNNMKITQPADYYIFKALYEVRESQQILGIV